MTLPHETDWIQTKFGARKIVLENYYDSSFRIVIVDRLGNKETGLKTKNFEYRKKWREAINRFERLTQQAQDLCA